MVDVDDRTIGMSGLRLCSNCATGVGVDFEISELPFLLGEVASVSQAVARSG